MTLYLNYDKLDILIQNDFDFNSILQPNEFYYFDGTYIYISGGHKYNDIKIIIDTTNFISTLHLRICKNNIQYIIFQNQLTLLETCKYLLKVPYPLYEFSNSFCKPKKEKLIKAESVLNNIKKNERSQIQLLYIFSILNIIIFLILCNRSIHKLKEDSEVISLQIHEIIICFIGNWLPIIITTIYVMFILV